MKKKLGYLLFLSMTFFSIAFADIIDVPYPDLPPKPIPAPEPVDDGEVVVIKMLFCIAIVLMMIVYYKKSNKVSE